MSIRADFKPLHLLNLSDRASFRAADILSAVENDLRNASIQGIPPADTVPTISAAVISALNKLSWEEQRRFVVDYGVAIGKLQRRAGKDYLQAIEVLRSQDRIQVIRGKFVRCESSLHDGVVLEYNDVEGNPRRLRTTIRVIINCTGFQNVTNSSSELIQSLLAQNLAVPSEGNRGFQVNENFEVSDDCYLIGPLLAGNCNQRLRIWHAESCNRIIGLSNQLAEVLIQAIQQQPGREREIKMVS